jgi:hypothetical protein
VLRFVESQAEPFWEQQLSARKVSQATPRRTRKPLLPLRCGWGLDPTLFAADSVERDAAIPHLPQPGTGIYAEWVLDLAKLDVDEIATALSDQTDYEHRWLIDPNTGQIAFWTSDTGIDGKNPVELDELDLIPIDPLPSHVWYQDMADFAEGVSDESVGRRLGRAIRGRGAFRRFKDELYEEHSELVPAWHAFRDLRAKRRAVQWLLDQGLIGDDAVRDFVTDHPEPDLP